MPLGRRAAEPCTTDDYPFYYEPEQYNVFWDVRKGLIPIVGAAREAGALRQANHKHTCFVGGKHSGFGMPNAASAVASASAATQRAWHTGSCCTKMNVSLYRSSSAILTGFHLCIAGTSMLIEDVACPVDRLPDMMTDLIKMFEKYGYDDASCFGHALEGNLHLVFSQARVSLGLLLFGATARCDLRVVFAWASCCGQVLDDHLC